MKNACEWEKTGPAFQHQCTIPTVKHGGDWKIDGTEYKAEKLLQAVKDLRLGGGSPSSRKTTPKYTPKCSIELLQDIYVLDVVVKG